MDDDVHRSSDSLPTSEEFEFIGSTEPQLHIAGNKSEEQLKETLQEVLLDIGDIMLDISPNGNLPTGMEQSKLNENGNFEELSEQLTNSEVEVIPLDISLDKDCSSDVKLSVYTTSPSPSDEDLMSISTTLADGDYTIFDRITYLGSAVIPDPNNEIEVRKNMAVLNDQSAKTLQVSLSLPVNSEGQIILYESSSSSEIANFPISHIKTPVSGVLESAEARCFALVHGSPHNAPDSVVFQCHVFRCEVPEAVSKVVQCITTAAKKVPRLPLSKSESFGSEKASLDSFTTKNNFLKYVFEVTVEFKEDEAKASCPRDKDYFKFRSKLEKSVIVTVQQVSGNRELVIERCFGLLISPGKNIRNSDMQLIEMVSFNKPTGEKPLYTVMGLWDPNESVFEPLNKETAKEFQVNMTVAADLVMAGIQEPVRFVIETAARIYPTTERFWYFSKRTLHRRFCLSLKEIELDLSGEQFYQVTSLKCLPKAKKETSSLTLSLSNFSSKSNLSQPSTPEDLETSSDDDEPLLSGTGEVSKDCTETELEGWSEVLLKWPHNQRPKNLTALVRRAVPEALRGEVWQLLAGCHHQNQVLETYKALIAKDSICDSIILRDIHRTFPAHEQFKEKSGPGQESLFKICKAYSIYDPEVGYCQGLSFLVAALLLHMPEEQAFGVLVKIMFDYQIRNMFRNSFEELHLKFYQLQKLMEDKMPDLAAHFAHLGIEVHMFASQWFLTLFTAKFPLRVVFYIIDLFLLDGMDVIFQVAISLLMLSQRELLSLDFEGILKHFRVTLPKKYRNEESSRLLIQNAVKVKAKKLKKYQKEYLALKEQEKTQGDPIKILQSENKSLLERNMRLDQENEDLAHDLLNKMHLYNDLVKSEEKNDILQKELNSAKLTITELEEEKKRLALEVAQLKEMCRRELQRAENESERSSTIIADYKQICSQMSSRLEKGQNAEKRNLELIKTKLESCNNCSKHLENLIPSLAPSRNANEAPEDKFSQLHKAEEQTRELELELARTKLALVEAECKNQDLNHQLNTAISEIQNSKNTWFQKTFSSIRDAGKRDIPITKEAC